MTDVVAILTTFGDLDLIQSHGGIEQNVTPDRIQVVCAYYAYGQVHAQKAVFDLSAISRDTIGWSVTDVVAM